MLALRAASRAHGQMLHAKTGNVSQHAKNRQRDEMGTLGSGNHYLEVQEVTSVYDVAIAQAFGLTVGDIAVMIHCGSRGLGHQIGAEFLKQMVVSAGEYNIRLPDRELACAPINSDVGLNHAPGSGRRGAVAHHDTGGERKPRKHEAELFARRIVDELDRARRQNRFDRLVLMAAPEFLGDLREVMPKSLSAAIVLEIRKDLVHQDERAIRRHLPADLFVEPV